MAEAAPTELEQLRGAAEIFRRPPHWVCPDCSEPNRVSRLECNNCQRPQPGTGPAAAPAQAPAPSAPSAPSAPPAATRWVCPGCRETNRIYRLVCNNCQRPQPGKEKEAEAEAERKAREAAEREAALAEERRKRMLPAFRIEVRLPSGDLLHTAELGAGGRPASGANLRSALQHARVEAAEYATLVCADSILLATDVLQRPACEGDALQVTFVRGEKPAPPPDDSSSSSSDFITPGGGRFHKRGGYSGPGSECLTGDCALTVLERGCARPRLMSELRVGDIVATGAPEACDAYRRVARIWPSPQPKGRRTATVRLSEGCRLTANHPVVSAGRWVRPLALGPEESTREEVLYGLEVEGHVDTVLAGGLRVAAIGAYCGEDFGWNVFTRKTVACERQPCAKCKVAVDASIDFSRIRPADLARRFPPY